MTEGSTPNGAIWRKVDLHLHSPASPSFHQLDGVDPSTSSGANTLVQTYVSHLVDAGIAVAAITDYNCVHVDWFEPIRDLAAQSNVYVFPGVEISIAYGKHGLHVLAIFPSSSRLTDLNTMLRSLDKQPGVPLVNQYGQHRDLELRDNLVDTLANFRAQTDCILILPHPVDDSGLCRTLQPADAARHLRALAPDALEHCPQPEIARLLSTNELDPSWLDNLARVEFSDPKSMDEIGTKQLADGSPRCTYLKLSAEDIAALKLALHDPHTRISLGYPPEATHPKLISVTISGTGFLGDMSINWNDDLNVIIGGRGTGKSAIIETLAYALDVAPHVSDTYREKLVSHALGSGGKVEVVLARHVSAGQSHTYRVTRILGERPVVRDSTSGTTIQISPQLLFGPGGAPIIFGQREINRIADDQSEADRLQLLDELIGEPAKQAQDDIQQALTTLSENADQIVVARKKVEDRDELRQKLQIISHEITVLEKNKASQKLDQLRKLKADEQNLTTAHQGVAAASSTLEQATQAIDTDLATHHKLLLAGTSEKKEILDQAATIIERLLSDFRLATASLQSKFAQAVLDLSAPQTKWQEIMDQMTDQLNKIKQEASAQSLDPDRLIKLTTQKAALEPQLDALKAVDDDLMVLFEQRTALLADLRERRHNQHTLRRDNTALIEQLVQGRLRLTVVFKGQKAAYKEQLTALSKGSGISSDALESLTEPEATDGIDLAEAIAAGTATIQQRFGLTPAMIERVSKWLGEEPRLLALQSLQPEDSLQVELKTDDQYRSLEHQSVGQKATSLLLLLFAFQTRPLILDQPEDDLDNRFVYEDIVQILRNLKGLGDAARRRQIITATHNANIPVLGDAELILGLEARDSRALITGRASIDDTRICKLVKTVMEGGEEAFRRRAEKYGGVS